jgi:hypothetical protein
MLYLGLLAQAGFLATLAQAARLVLVVLLVSVGLWASLVTVELVASLGLVELVASLGLVVSLAHQARVGTVDRLVPQALVGRAALVVQPHGPPTSLAAHTTLALILIHFLSRVGLTLGWQASIQRKGTFLAAMRQALSTFLLPRTSCLGWVVAHRHLAITPD